ILYIQNLSAFDLTIAHMDAGSGDGKRFRNPGAVNIVLKGGDAAASATYMCDGVTPTWRLMSFQSTSNAIPTSFTSSTNRGTITLVAGTGTATVTSGAVCTCTDTTAANPVQCAVS